MRFKKINFRNIVNNKFSKLKGKNELELIVNIKLKILIAKNELKNVKNNVEYEVWKKKRFVKNPSKCTF